VIGEAGEPLLSSMFLASSADRPLLRVGLVLDSLQPSRAIASVIGDLQKSTFVTIELLVLTTSAPAGVAKGSWLRRALERVRSRQARAGIAFAIYAWLDERRAGFHDDPMDPEDVSASVDGIEAIRTTPIAEGAWDHLSPEVVARVQDAGLDVLLECGSRRLAGAILGAARFGVWSLDHGDNERFVGGPACFWEMADGSPVTSVVLVRSAGEGGGRVVLDRASFATDAASMTRTRHQASYGSTHLVIRRLLHLHQWGWEWIEGHAPPPLQDPGPRRIDRSPTNRDVLAWFLPLALRRVLGRAKRAILRSDDLLHWRIAVRLGHGGLRLDGPADMSGFAWLEAPRGHFYADPFVVERDGRHWVLLEDFSYATGVGVIGCGEVTPTGEFVYAGSVLASPGHLSYPMAVVDGDDVFMVPESSAEGRVRVYRAASFPHGWEVIAEPYAGAAVDTSIWHQDGRWWFFTTVREPRGKADMLLLFHAASVDGAWVPHPMNPVSQDVRAVRGAGGLFLDDGRLVRPTQDGSRGYGYAFILNEIATLSETDFLERPRLSIGPDWGPELLGTHTYNRAGRLEVTDGKVARARRAVV
jgi:hypothetical protein